MSEHECGYNCPFLIEDEGGYVCTKTGRCFGQLFDNSVEIHGVLVKGDVKNNVAQVKRNDKQRQPSVNSKDDGKNEKDVAECVVLIKRLGANNKKQRVDSMTTRQSIKAALSYFKSADGTHKNIVQAVAYAQKEYNANSQKFESEKDDDFYTSIALRCLRCYKLSTSGNIKKTPRRDYIFLAFLYILRDGMNVNDVTFVEREPHLNDILPNLHCINEYGFDKGKFTRSDKFLRSFFKNSVGKVSIKSLQI